MSTLTKWRAIPTVPPIEPGTYNMLDALSENLRKAQTAINTLQGASYSGLFSVAAGKGLTVSTSGGVATVSAGTELAGVASLSTTGFVQRTGTGTYITVSSTGGAPGRGQAGVPTDVQPYGFIHENTLNGDLYVSRSALGYVTPRVVNFGFAGTVFVSTPTNHYELTMPFTPTAGNLVVIGTFNNTYTTAPTGWTIVHQAAGAFTNSTWYAKVWTASDPLTHIVWPDGSSVLLNVWEINGVGTGTVASAFDGGSTTGATTGTPFSGFSGFRTTVANEFALSIGTTSSSSDPPVTFDISWTQDSTGTGQNTAAHKTIVTAGSQVTLTQNSQGYYTNRSLSAITLKPSPVTVSGWSFLGPVTAYSSGVRQDTALRSLNVTGNATLTSDGSGNVSINVGGSSSPVLTGSGPPGGYQPTGTLYVDTTDTSGGYLYVSRPIYTPGSTPPIVVQTTYLSTTGNSGGPAVPVTMTLPAAPTVGNLLVAIVLGAPNPTPYTPAGWTVAFQASPTSEPAGALLYRYVQSGDTAVQTVQSDSVFGSVTNSYLWELSGVPPLWSEFYQSAAQNYNVVGSALSATTNTLVSLPAPTTSTNTFALAFAVTSTVTGSSATADPAWTSDYNVASNFAGHKTYSAGVTASYVSVFDGVRSFDAVVATFNPWGPGTYAPNWAEIGPVTIKAAGTTIDSKLASLNFSTGLTATTDSAGNITVTASGGGGSSVTFGSGSPSASTTPSVDGTPVTNGATNTTTGTVTFTAAANRVAVLYIGIEQNPAVVVNTVTSPHLTWTRRAQAGPTQGDRAKDEIEVWWATVSAAVTSEVVTVTASATFDNISLGLVVVQNVGDITNPWDPNSSLPSISTNTGPGGSATPAPVFSTTNGYGLAIAASYNDVSRTETSVWSTVFAANYSTGANWSFLTGWSNSYSTAQSGVTASLTSTDTGIHVRLVDVLTGYHSSSASEGSIYFDSSTTPFTEYVYHSGAWHQAGASGGGVAVQSAGTALGTATTLNFTGSGVSAALAAGVGTITVSGGGGGAAPVYGNTQSPNASSYNSASAVLFAPLGFVPAGVTLTSVTQGIQTASSSSWAVGIYSDVSGSPSALLASSATQTNLVAGENTASLSYTSTGQFLWAAFTATGTFYFQTQPLGTGYYSSGGGGATLPSTASSVSTYGAGYALFATGSGGSGGSGGYTYLGGGTYTNVTEIDFTSLITSAHTTYVIEYDDVSVSVNGTDVGVQLSSDNGTTWISSGYTYGCRGYGIQTNYEYYINNTAVNYMLLMRTLSNTQSYSTQGRFEVRGLSGTTYKKVSMSRGVSQKNDGNIYFEEQSSISSTTAAVNAMRIVQSGSATLSGTFKLYGI